MVPGPFGQDQRPTQNDRLCLKSWVPELSPSIPRPPKVEGLSYAAQIGER